VVIFGVGMRLAMLGVAVGVGPVGRETMLGAYFVLDEKEVSEHHPLAQGEHCHTKEACSVGQLGHENTGGNNSSKCHIISFSALGVP
jgi:hypothetical protein